MSFEKFKRSVTVYYINIHDEEHRKHHDDVAWYGYTDEAFEVRQKSDLLTDEKYEDKFIYAKDVVVRVEAIWGERDD